MAKIQDTHHIRLRIDPARLARLEKSAEKNGRTLTGEIIHRLDASFQREDLTAFVERLSDQVTVKVTEVLKPGRVVTASDVRKGEKQ
jgi:hypothetical protein